MTIVESLHSQPTNVTRVPHVIAVASGKGGVGKSSISVNLGIALSRMGRKVCIFDADTGLANINILLGLTPQYTLEHVLFGAKTLDEVMLTGPYELKVIPGANGISECVSLHTRQQLRLTRELSQIETEFDYVLVDTAAGISEITLDFAHASHQTLIVITPEPTSLTDAFSLVKLLKRRGKQNHFHVVVNMCSSANQAREVFHRFSAAVDKYIGIALNYLGFVLQDESLRAAVTMQTPVTLFQEDDPSCRSFFRLGQSLETALADVKPVASFSAYWQSLYRQRRQEEKGAQAEQQLKPGPVRAAPVEQLRIYLGELRSRLITLMAQGRLPATDFADLIKDLQQSMQDYFVSVPDDTNDKAAIDIAAEIERFIAEQAHDQTLLLNLYNKIAPLVTPSVNNTEQPTISDVDIRYTQPVNASVESPKIAMHKKTAAHAYDEQRFGSQQQLLEQLRRGSDLPLVEWVSRVTL
jgi:flagellar biosynthesis protein FlhG